MKLDYETTASFDVDAQCAFSSLCPDELPVEGALDIVSELNAQAKLASVRVGSRDAHSMSAVWIATEEKPQFSKVDGYADVDIRWKAHAIVGTKGFEFLPGLEESAYDYQVYKGIDPTRHPYGACYQDLGNKLSTGVIEYLKVKGVKTVLVGGLATDYCVKNTVVQLLDAGFSVVLNLAASRGISEKSVELAVLEMQEKGATVIASSSELSNASSLKVKR